MPRSQKGNTQNKKGKQYCDRFHKGFKYGPHQKIILKNGTPAKSAMPVTYILALLGTCDHNTDQGQPGIRAASVPGVSRPAWMGFREGLQGLELRHRRSCVCVELPHVHTFMQSSADQSLMVCTFRSPWAV